ncbi:MAG: response regulator transcription factor [Oscillospiraceae bacterium]|nr:response regulator transcription factor [Oscillospiraceae bacterium]
MYRLLVVDDEKEIRNLIEKYATFEGNEVSCASNGMEAVELCRENQYDLIIMDVMMPELDGFSAVAMIRKFSNTPVIMLSARGEEYDRIHGFEIGVDDYVVKPFSPRELMLRINAVLNRTVQKETEPASAEAPSHEHEKYEYKGLEIDFTARTVDIDSERIDMSPKEYDLLFYLVKNRGIALTRDKLLSDIWGYDFYGVDRTLDTHIKLLRKKLGEYSSCIVTLRGVGYRFEEA